MAREWNHTDDLSEESLDAPESPVIDADDDFDLEDVGEGFVVPGPLQPLYALYKVAYHPAFTMKPDKDRYGDGNWFYEIGPWGDKLSGQDYLATAPIADVLAAVDEEFENERRDDMLGYLGGIYESVLRVTEDERIAGDVIRDLVASGNYYP